MQNKQRSTFYASDYNRYGNEYKNSVYLQDPKAIGRVSKRNTSNKYTNGKMLNRRLKSGHSNNRPNLSVYTASQNFVDPVYSNIRRKGQGKRGKSNKPKNEKPYTAQQNLRIQNLNEQNTESSLKESYVASIKKTLENEEI